MKKNTKSLSRSAKIAMLDALQSGELNERNESELRRFLGQEQIILTYCGTKEEAEEIIRSVPDISI